MKRIRLIFEENVLVKSSDANMMSKCWFLLNDNERQCISDVHIQIIKQFAPHILDANIPIALTMDDFVMLPSLNANCLIRDGDTIVVKRRNVLKRKRDEKPSDIQSDKKDQKNKKKNKRECPVVVPQEKVQENRDQTKNQNGGSHHQIFTSQKQKKQSTDQQEIIRQSVIQQTQKQIATATPQKPATPKIDQVLENITPKQHHKNNAEKQYTPKRMSTPVSQKITPKSGSGSYFANLKQQLQSQKVLPNQQRSAYQQYQHQESIQVGSTSNPSDLGDKVPERSYSGYNPKVGDPIPGEVLAYKTLELSANMTPEISSFKEGKVIRHDKESNTVLLKHLHPPLQIQKRLDNLHNIIMEDEEDIEEDGSDLYERSWHTMKNVLLMEAE